MISLQDRRVSSDGVLLWAVVAAAWGLTGFAVLTGDVALVDHDRLLGTGKLPSPGDLLLFLVAWQVMTAAMMLPSSLPMVRHVARASQGQTRPRLAFSAFLAAYFVVWTGFALAALLGDAGLHALVQQWTWLAERPELISGTLLLVAAGFQFSPLKERCLQECRSPLGFLWRHYQRGVGAAWGLGVRHGLFCLGCCWALMLVMFGVGVGSLFWLTTLTGVMVIEKTTRRGRKLVPYVGIALFILGIIAISGMGSYLPIPLVDG